MDNTILITGATGNYGKAAIEFLLKNGISPNTIYAMVRDEKKAGILKEKGVHLRFGDYNKYDTLEEAFKGIDKVLLISGSELVNREKQHENVINAAKKAGVKHILYTSGERRNETETSPLALVFKSHIYTEKVIKESGMKYTIFRNNLYMDFLPMYLGEKILERGIIFPAGQTKAAFALRIDLAEATANVLAGVGHENKEYRMSNSVNYSFQNVADILSKLTNKFITYTSPDTDAYIDSLNKAGVPKEYVGMSVGFAEAVKQGELYVPKADLENLLGRKPVSLETFLEQVFLNRK